MTTEAFELLKLVISFVSGGFVSLVLGQPVKNWWDRRRQYTEQQQTRWAPLYRAARKLQSRLLELSAIYTQQPPADPWGAHTYEIDGRTLRYPSIARDFHELYLLDGGGGPITSFYAPGLASPVSAREDATRVNKMWTRLHELTLAASSMHVTAELIAHAERVRAELEDRRLIVAASDRAQVLALLHNVRQVLSGRSRAGVLVEHQELIAENVWKNESTVIDLYSFYRLLLGAEWPKFTGLFRFFLEIQYKIDHEVVHTREALEELCHALEGMFPNPRLHG